MVGVHFVDGDPDNLRLMPRSLTGDDF